MKCNKRKSKRTRACEIKPSIKQKVWERQNGVSVYSGTPISINECCCHVLSRNKGGRGIEENIVGLTQYEHKVFDGNRIGNKKEETDKIRKIVRKHLEENYPGWNEEMVRYRK